MNPFQVKAKHWWDYLNPLWFRRKRIVEKVLKYQWEHGGRQEFERQLKNNLLYGNPYGDIWK